MGADARTDTRGALEQAGMQFGTMQLGKAAVAVFDASKFEAPAVAAPSADMPSVRESLGAPDFTAAMTVLDGSNPAEWRATANNFMSAERGAHHRTDLYVSCGNSELHIRAFGGNGYYNEFPGPYFEAVLDHNVRLSEDEARQLYDRANARMREFSEEFNPAAKERAQKVFDGLPGTLAGAEWRRVTPEERDRGVIAVFGPPDPRPKYDYFKARIGDVEVTVRKQYERRLLGLIDGAQFDISVYAASKPSDVYWGVNGWGDCVGGTTTGAKELYRQIEANLQK